MQHDWIKSTLGHGETMCSRCFVTTREAAAIGMDECDVSQAAEEDGCEPGEECGRWDNGRLSRYCSKAGTEECDFECPYGFAGQKEG